MCNHGFEDDHCDNSKEIFIIEWDSTKPLNDFFGTVEWKELFQNWVARVRNGYFIQTEPSFQYECRGNL
ncbi:hypothetical protein ABN764_05270 [Paenibacillaceae sp. P-4]|uniref:hypothetical protein n=1 Tax=Paenibacillaceae bacterium P-4 TaxID=3160969 RepID=UPI0032E80CA8